MDFFEQMRLHAEDLTPTERRVLDAVMDNPEGILQSTDDGSTADWRFKVRSAASAKKVGYENLATSE